MFPSKHLKTSQHCTTVKILHIDMDAFYASVEQRDNPALRGRPVAVGGGGRRGVVAAASYEARQYGVRSAMPGYKAQQLCPEIIFVRSRFDVYQQVSRQIREIFYDYTDLVEPLSLDEAYLDVTENKKGIASGTVVATEIRTRIFEETQLTASAGVSFNKFLAKIASDINKPNGMKVITPEEAIPFLAALPVEKFHGVGKVTARRMHNMGIYTGGDLKQFSEIELVQRFGKTGRWYYRIVRAVDKRAVNPNRIRKSISAERTFNEDYTTFTQLKEKLEPIVERVHDFMSKKDNFGRTLTLKMKSSDFKIVTRSKSFPAEVRDLVVLKDTAFALLRENHKEVGAIRLLGFGVSNLAKEHNGEGIQLEFDFDKK